MGKRGVDIRGRKLEVRGIRHHFDIILPTKQLHWIDRMKGNGITNKEPGTDCSTRCPRSLSGDCWHIFPLQCCSPFRFWASIGTSTPNLPAFPRFRQQFLLPVRQEPRAKRQAFASLPSDCRSLPFRSALPMHQ